MALKRLPNDVQFMLCASAQINNYKRAIEELMYNSLDAGATSIAIRINIQESTIQIIDNGHGVTKHDFNAIGHRYMTSKLTDISTLKAVPKYYGHRGEFLANIITVSQMVKITSRHESTEETWAKTFCDGKEQKFAKMTTRPTNGTTVDVKGFLYNLNIQKRGIDPINELQNIKLFLEQLSLVHNNISISLRDDSKNEIIFKIHKKRDIYQTLSTLFDIEKTDVLELQVEKHEYKVKGFIKKGDKDIDIHLIYLNGKCMFSNSKLHKIINEYFKKLLLIKDQRKLKSKKNNDEHQLFAESIPFYFIFITCPNIDYDMSYSPKQLEFKNWEQINKLLEKLVKFYVGDVNLKEITHNLAENKVSNKEQTGIKFDQNTRDEVKKIMDKILGNNSKKLGFSQLQNGVKGKLAKRKIKSKTKQSAHISKLCLQKDNKNTSVTKTSKPIKHIVTNLHVDEQCIYESANALNKRKETKTSEVPRNLDRRYPKNQNLKYMASKKMQIKPKNKTSIKQKHKTLNDKHKKTTVYVKEFNRLINTDSVYKRSKAVARKIEKFLHDTKKRKTKIQIEEHANSKSKKNVIHPSRYTQYDKAINNNIALKTQVNKIIDQYLKNKIKAKNYKTTYDLVKTVLLCSQESINTDKNNIIEIYNKKTPSYDYRLKDLLHYAPTKFTRDNKNVLSTDSDFYSNKKIVRYSNDVKTQYKTHYNDNYYSSPYSPKQVFDIIPNTKETSDFLYEHIRSKNQSINFSKMETSCQLLTDPLRILTYDSHQYHRNEGLETNSHNYINERQNITFISKQSRDNFVTTNNFGAKFKKPYKLKSNKRETRSMRMRHTIDESAYTIEYSKSNENNNDVEQNDKMVNDVNFPIDVDYFMGQTNADLDNVSDQTPIFGNTYTVQQKTKHKPHELYDTYSIHNFNSEIINETWRYKTSSENEDRNVNNFNIIFVSKSQCSGKNTPLDNNITIEPLNICETVFRESQIDEREFELSFNENNRFNDSLYCNFENMNGFVNNLAMNAPVKINRGDTDIVEDISRHFRSTTKSKEPHGIELFVNGQDFMEDNSNNNMNTIIRTQNKADTTINNSNNLINIDCNFEINKIRNRPRFLPKGMSQIFENCRSKTACDYILEKEYYDNSIYNNFANDVQLNSEVYVPLLQHVENVTTKNIHKFQNKVKKDNASLVFDESSLKDAKVLGQVDCKFIAAIMKTRCTQTEETSEYLVLFDQHAVHERIRLEENLADYINEEKWKSISVNDITLKMSNDEILYLHNYKDKFNQLGLNWTILNDNQIIVNSIPEAILGKNPREVEKVIKAVRYLIVEEINVIKLQKGCVALYPKSIMDLVFSEACRYAIKFGDHISKNNCVELLNALSTCKTPFQCAHGRPVMAVIMDIKIDKREYKINMTKISRFKKKVATNP